jgi:hypothetical protein
MKNSKGFEENLYYNRIGDKPTGIIRCYSGIYVDVFNPTEDMFDIQDIAHGLSMIPRFGGHMKIFYPVSQHCIDCVYMDKFAIEKFSVEDRFDLLMHDCSEAYLLDIPSPIKKLLNGYSDIEDNLMKVLSKKFRFNYPFKQIIKDIDRLRLEIEWNSMVINLTTSSTYKQEKSKSQFLNLFELLSISK